MNWLEKNPLGTGLLAAGGLLVVLGVAMTLLWRGVPDTDSASLEGDGAMAMPETAELDALEPLGAYEIVNNRPVFNTTRRPQARAVLTAGWRTAAVFPVPVAA